MPQIAGFRGLVWDASKVDVAHAATSPLAAPHAAIERGELLRDATRAVYRYHQVFRAGPRTLVRKMWFAAIALEPWTEASVRRHEETDPRERAVQLSTMSNSHLHAEPVLVGYRDAAGEVERLFRKAEGGAPLYDFTTADGTQHKLWRCNSAELIGALRPLFAPKKLHVLDDPGRYEAMISFRDRLAEAEPVAMYSSANFGLGCLVNMADPALVVGARHRVVRAGEADAQRTLEAAKRYFIVEPLPGAAKDVAKQMAALGDTVAHQPAFVALFPGQSGAWKLTLSPDVSPVAEGVTAPRGIQKYDPFVVDQLFLRLVVPDLTAEVARDADSVIAAVEGGAPLGVILRPLTIDQLVHVDDLGALLPIGSTAFYPPIAPHLVAYAVDPNEDVV
jgi:uncharacterized protein (DUF1015 family)